MSKGKVHVKHAQKAISVLRVVNHRPSVLLDLTAPQAYQSVSLVQTGTTASLALTQKQSVTKELSRQAVKPHALCALQGFTVR